MSGFTLLSAFLSAQKSAQGPSEPLCFLGLLAKSPILRRSDFVCPTRCNCFGGLVFVRGMKAISVDEDQRCLVCDLN